ncbi:MAG: PIN domain-containing protein [Aeromicrobium sp.]|uniref:type II toxin-antitoxin system VapC family toxin n=1 Tax=Aeromicrobium sp. TaxID=1871063 RepID=UPI0039E36522
MRSEKYRYIDSSVALRILWGQSSEAVEWFLRARADGWNIVSSQLLELEVIRAARRENTDLDDARRWLGELPLLDLDRQLVREASDIEPHVKSLDALHLAAALRVGVDDVVIISHDTALKRVASLLGFDVHDPVTA